MNGLHLSVDTKLSLLLPLAVVEDVIAPLAAVFDFGTDISICDLDGTVYYGQPGVQRVQATIMAGTESIATVGVPVHPAHDIAVGVIDHLGRTFSHVATEIARRRQAGSELLERYDELNLVYDLATLIAEQALSPQEVVDVVLVEASRILHADMGAVYLVDDTGTDSMTPTRILGHRQDTGFWQGELLEMAAETLDTATDAQRFDGGHVICVPLRHGSERLGVLLLLHDGDQGVFTASDASLLTALAHNTALFLQVARLYDSLTQRNLQLERALADLQSARDELSRAERLTIIGQTVSGLVHDMRNPLGIIMGYAGLLQEGGLSQTEVSDYAGHIMRYVDVFSSMAQEVLDYTQADSRLERRPVKLAAYLEEIERHLSPPGLSRAVEIVVRHDDLGGLTINVDPGRFARVFQNLVNNAIDAIEEHGGSRIVIDVKPDGEVVRFSVCDNGPGVPPDKVKAIFEPFMTTKARGTGLGLAIVTHIVEIHGGSIHYETGPEGGACFVFTVPIS